MMTLFCGDTSRCICSFNYAFTSDHALTAHDDAAAHDANAADADADAADAADADVNNNKCVRL